MLTRRGRDYLLATVLVVVVSSLLDLRLMDILGLSLAAMAVVSTAVYAFAGEKKVEITTDKRHVRVFKEEESEVVLGFEPVGGWAGLRLVSYGFDNVQVTETEPLPGGKVRLRFIGRYAGRSEGLKVRLAAADPLGLFQTSSELLYEDLVLDVLPRSLLALVVPMTVPAFGLGERSSGYPGPGQELYGLDSYHPSTGAKDIIWKRAARSPGEDLVERVRESNSKESVKVGVVRVVERGEDGRRWTDALCEGLASIGKEVLQMNMRLTILHPSDGGPVESRISDLDGLAEAVMSCSAAPASADLFEVVRRSDLIVTGLRELEDERIARAISAKPLLLISEEASPVALGGRSVVYSGSESFLPLLRRMLER
jgi:uncharacterized protein (DUF58 family)